MYLTTVQVGPKNFASFVEWTQVVLPGHGLGSVRANNVLETVDRLAGRSSVRRLYLIISAEKPNDSIHDVARKQIALDVLSVIGSELEYLSLGMACCDLMAEDMCSILTKCPHLKTVSVEHDGSCWSHMNSAWVPDKPRLEELEIVIRETFQPLVAPQLNHLKVFRLTTIISPTENFDPIYHSFCLLEQYPQLKKLVVVCTGQHLERTVKRRQIGHTFLRNSIVPGVNDYTQDRLDTRSRIAFLSVIDPRNTQCTNALAQVGQDLAQHIFSFCSSPVPRTFHVNEEFETGQ